MSKERFQFENGMVVDTQTNEHMSLRGFMNYTERTLQSLEFNRKERYEVERVNAKLLDEMRELKYRHVMRCK